GPESDTIVEDTTVTCTEANGVSVITITFPSPRSLRRRSEVDVEVSAPERCDVSISTQGHERSLLTLTRGGGDIRLRGPVGDVDVTMPSADLSAETITGSLSFKSASGDLDIAAVHGTVKVRSASGDVSIEEAGDDVSIALVSGDVTIGTARKHVDVTSVSGDVSITDAYEGATAKSTSGDTTVRRAWKGTVRAATVSGDVAVGIPSGRGVSVDARSMSGNLSSEIDLSSDRSDGGEGGDVIRVTAHSVSGDVEILRAATATA
ncbi:MAG TPA: DUF4097 family beta strand repeat-containing protein, partial [Acidimicrobiales bacterium]|nr:DUF4097 family beta strand repeat-containing protein [Acidimicrobiales bacterium]